MTPIEWLTARAAITDVLYAYCRLLDAGDIDRLVELFTPDCVVDYGPGPTSRVVSREAYRGWLKEHIGRFAHTSHHLTNVEVELDGERARAYSYLHAWHRYLDRQPVALLWGRYVDDLVRAGDGYLIAGRQLLVAGSQGLDGEWHPTPPRVPAALPPGA